LALKHGRRFRALFITRKTQSSLAHRRSQLSQSAHQSVRRIPTLQAPPADQKISRRRQARFVRRSRNRQGRPTRLTQTVSSGSLVDQR
jgi:hypothetical protein